MHSYTWVTNYYLGRKDTKKKRYMQEKSHFLVIFLFRGRTYGAIV